jgi:hypothetical protein
LSTGIQFLPASSDGLTSTGQKKFSLNDAGNDTYIDEPPQMPVG